MNKYQIVIPHTNAVEYNKFPVAITPFHNWEHLFIRILERFFYKDNVKILGFCTLKSTVITILSHKKIDDKVSKDVIINLLKRYYLSPKWIKRENVIINNELSCMELLYGIDYRKSYGVSPLNYREMNKFRRNNYQWENISTIEQGDGSVVPVVKKKDTKLVSHIELISQKRSQLMDIFYSDEKGNQNPVDKKENFYLICIPVYDSNGKITFEEFSKMISELDTQQGFYLIKFKSKYPMSIVTWPSVESRGNITWLTVFTYIKNDYLNFFIDVNVAALVSVLENYGKLQQDEKIYIRNMKEKVKVYISSENH